VKTAAITQSRRGVLLLLGILTIGLIAPGPIAADSTATAIPDAGPPGTQVEVSWSVADSNPGDCFITQIDSVRIFWAKTEADPLRPGDSRLTEREVVARDRDPSDGDMGVSFIVPRVAPGTYNFRWYCPLDGPNVTGPFPFVVTASAPATDTVEPNAAPGSDAIRIVVTPILALVAFAAFWRRTSRPRSRRSKGGAGGRR
jgi:hypothetical protein